MKFKREIILQHLDKSTKFSLTPIFALSSFMMMFGIIFPPEALAQNNARKICVNYMSREYQLSNDAAFRECEKYMSSYECLLDKSSDEVETCGWGCSVHQDATYYGACSEVPGGSCNPEEFGWDFDCTEGEKDSVNLS